jgi:hypothetical protein
MSRDTTRATGITPRSGGSGVVTPSTLERLHHIIEAHQVVYEYWPAKVAEAGKQLAVGHDIMLIGTHGGHMQEMTTPGCNQCAAVWRDLEELADTVIQPPTSLSHSRIVPFSGAVHYARERGLRSDIELVIEIRHRSNYQAPTDECEDQCLSATLVGLREIGVPERRWSSEQRLDGHTSC